MLIGYYCTVQLLIGLCIPYSAGRALAASQGRQESAVFYAIWLDKHSAPKQDARLSRERAATAGPEIYR